MVVVAQRKLTNEVSVKKTEVKPVTKAELLFAKLQKTESVELQKLKNSFEKLGEQALFTTMPKDPVKLASFSPLEYYEVQGSNLPAKRNQEAQDFVSNSNSRQANYSNQSQQSNSANTRVRYKNVKEADPQVPIQNQPKNMAHVHQDIKIDPHTLANMTFEEVLMDIMMKIARQEEKKLMEKIKILERNDGGGLNGFLSNTAKTVGGVAGAVGGALVGGALGDSTTGASVGRDIGERVVTSYTGDNSPESRQLQFEKLKFDMQRYTEMMSSLSNTLGLMHQTTKNTIANIRG